MPNQTITPSNTRRTNYDVLWGTHEFNGVDKVDLSKIALLLEGVEIGSTGKMKLDDRYVAFDPNSLITVQAREITRARIEKLVPWFAGSSGAVVPMAPAVNTLMASSYAAALVLHPRDKADASEDLKFYKAVPVQSVNLSRDGKADDVWEITFRIYPDLSKLPNNPYAEVTAAA